MISLYSIFKYAKGIVVIDTEFIFCLHVKNVFKNYIITEKCPITLCLYAYIYMYKLFIQQ